MRKELMVAGAVLFLAGLLAAREGVRMELTSSAFQEGGSIPSLYTCDGKDISPPLRWSGTPAGTKSLALIVDDPDAPAGTWVHWVLWNLPVADGELAEGITAGPPLASGALQGKNDFGQIGYGGPCPPYGTHRYFFNLYALDSTLPLKAGATKSKLEAAMKGHVLAQATCMGVYRRR